MDLFRRKAKEPPAHKDERAHATIGAMERATAERMVRHCVNGNSRINLSGSCYGERLLAELAPVFGQAISV
jgi:hypothetical protein